ncbi:MAG: AcrR family transcriptional regulator [Bradymonadia bacterium]|jgi:AcrR family transcriptional regulator
MVDEDTPELSAGRQPLSVARVIEAAVALADASGLKALSMRKIGQALGVEAMSLYAHVANKGAILDGMIDHVLGLIEVPAIGAPWKAAMRRRATSARNAMMRHRWAISLVESRSDLGPAGMRYYDSIIGCMRQSGFSIELAAHAFSAIDSYIYGFALQQVKMPYETTAELEAIADDVLAALPAEQFPHFTEMIVGHVMQPGYNYDDEFEFGLEVLLDGFERLLAVD